MSYKTYYLDSCIYTHIEKAMPPAQWSKCENIHFLQFRVNSNLWTIISTQVINNLNNATIQVLKYLPAKKSEQLFRDNN